MQTYKTDPELRAAMKSKRDAIKAAGGAEYEALLAKERAQRAKYRAQNRDKVREERRARDRGRTYPFKTWLCAQARQRGRAKGLEATITSADLVWPSHCPVLGIELDYPKRSGQRKDLHAQPNWPSLDRWNPSLGYVPGNVFVVSFRANTLKNSGSYEEMLRVCRYLARKPMQKSDTAAAEGALLVGDNEVTAAHG